MASLWDIPAQEEGFTDSHWKKMKVLGSGFYGTVYLARPAVNSGPDGPTLAVKSVDTENVKCKESLKWEMKVLHRLAGSPNVVRCYGRNISSIESDSGKRSSTFYNLVLEYAPEGTLHDLIRRGVPHEAQAACYAAMILRGLAAIHSRGIIHCDLKPSNILVFPGPIKDLKRLKIADFGLARVSSEEEKGSVFWEGPTRKYFNRGTAMYSSPESVDSGRHDKCADIWSLGCIMYEMVTGKRIWQYSGDLEDLYDHIMYVSYKPPKGLTPGAKNFLARCLERDPASRWSAEELLEHYFIKGNTRVLKIARGVDLNQIV